MNTFIINNNKFNKKKVVFIMGEIGTGKSCLCVDLATHFRGEIINLDKMQVYKGLEIVKNKITHAEKQGVWQYLLGEIVPDSSFMAEDFFLKSIVYMEFFVEDSMLVDEVWQISFQMQITPKESDCSLVSLKWPDI
ncbi:hypothetical protein H5410_001668 [Solanum commersonii]|uniref:Uncharacterized protein n=1 Tax=Solanum commersonii TaxID=4109 RepID=A0A9J6B0R0_SOLCO|nr:hypothetical protein H5410_001668 [Solanum commersonii]